MNQTTEFYPEITFQDVLDETLIGFRHEPYEKRYTKVCPVCHQTRTYQTDGFGRTMIFEKGCSCEDIKVDRYRSPFLGRIDFQAVHIYPESDAVIRFVCYGEEVDIMSEDLEDPSFVASLNRPIQEIGFVRFHLDGTIEQAGDVDFLNPSWKFGNASKHGLIKIKKNAWDADNIRRRPSQLCCYYIHRVNNKKQLIGYNPVDQTDSPEYIIGVRQPFYLKVHESIATLEHPVAKQHPYFHVFNPDKSQTIGSFMDGFVAAQQLFTRHPQMEHVAKAGLQRIIEPILEQFMKEPTKKFQLQRYFKPGETLADIIGMEEALINLLIEEDLTYKMYQTVIKIHNESPLHEESLRILIENAQVLNVDQLWRCIKKGYAESMELLMYLRSCWTRQGIYMGEALSIWEAYYDNATNLNMPFKKFPMMLKLAQKITERDYQELRSETKQKLFEERVELFAHLNFEDEETGYGIYVPKTPHELILDRRTLNHHMGSYQRPVAKGEHVILFVRSLKKPDQSLYTLEWDLKCQEKVQLRGKSNSEVTNKTVKQFLRKWEKRQVNQL